MGIKGALRPTYVHSHVIFRTRRLLPWNNDRRSSFPLVNNSKDSNEEEQTDHEPCHYFKNQDPHWFGVFRFMSRPIFKRSVLRTNSCMGFIEWSSTYTYIYNRSMLLVHFQKSNVFYAFYRYMQKFGNLPHCVAGRCLGSLP